jgi:serine/threonine protein kinase
MRLVPGPEKTETLSERGCLTSVEPGVEPFELSADFELLSVLGEGGGGRVYLARDRSLHRQVALKVVTDSGAEASTLAQLEHDHIVRVFSEKVEREHHARLICMQYVPGTTLTRVMTQLQRRGTDATGAAILDAIDALSVGEAALEPALLVERAELERADAISATCLIGAALARALAHAHRRGVVHRDVKPGNILMTPYGRPMLVDFNVAASSTSRVPSPFGATLRYASPEQMLVLMKRAPADSVDARTDLFSFAAVLFELLAGRLPFDPLTHDVSLKERYAARVAPLRRLERPERSALVLERVLHRCLAPDSSKRYASADELAAALEACAALRAYERELPPPDVFVRAATHSPMMTLAAGGVVPHLLGSSVVVSYARWSPWEALSAAQLDAFRVGTIIYDAVAYPVGVTLYALLIWYIARKLRLLASSGPGDADASGIRRSLVLLPARGAAISLLAWALSVPFFPWFISMTAEPLAGTAWANLAISHIIAGVTAVSFGAVFLLHVTLRSILPWATADGRDLGDPPGLVTLPRTLRLVQLVGAGMPPVAAVLLLALAPGPFDPPMRALVIVLLCVGVLGFTALTHFTGEATQSVEALERLRARAAKRRPASHGPPTPVPAPVRAPGIAPSRMSA